MSNNQNKYILAIDHGTSGGKVAIVSTTGEVVDWAFNETPMILGEGGRAEQDPDVWWDAIVKSSQEVIQKGRVKIEDIVGICNTSQWSGTVPVDKDGNHIMNNISWMDTRGAKQMEKLYSGLLKVDNYNLIKALKYIRKTGGAPTPSGKDSIAHIMWLKEERPEIYEKTYKFLEPQDYINLKLTGKIAASYASIHLHWVTDTRNIENIKYSNGLVRMVKIDREKLPDLKNSVDILGPITNKVADLLGLDKKTKVVMGAPDLHAAAVGSGAIKNYQGHICVGTSDWLLLHVPKMGTDIDHNFGTVVSALPGKYLLSNEQEIAGGCLSFLRDNVLYHKDELLSEEEVPDVYKIFDKIVEGVKPGSDKLIFTPWLYGERAPKADHTIRGGLYNISLETNREHIIRAIFEGVAYNVRWLHMYIEKFIKRKLDNLHIIGGGANSRIWCQIFADVLDRNIKQVKNPIQSNARGAALIGALGLGYIEQKDIAKHTEINEIFKPNPKNKTIYNQLFKEYVNIYKAMKKIYKRLNKSH